MLYTTVLQELASCEYFSNTIIAFQGNNARLNYNLANNPDDRLKTSGQVIYRIANEYFKHPGKQHIPFCAFVDWSLSERYSVRDPATEEVKEEPDSHYRAMIVDKEKKVVVLFEPNQEYDEEIEKNPNLDERQKEVKRQDRRMTWPRSIKKFLQVHYKTYKKHVVFGAQTDEPNCGELTINFIKNYECNRNTLNYYEITTFK